MEKKSAIADFGNLNLLCHAVKCDHLDVLEYCCLQTATMWLEISTVHCHGHIIASKSVCFHDHSRS